MASCCPLSCLCISLPREPRVEGPRLTSIQYTAKSITRMVHSQFAQSHFARIFPVLPVLFSPFPTLPFSHFAKYLSCSFPILPKFIFTHLFISPRSYLALLSNFAQLSHFALFPQGPFPFRPNAIFLIFGPKTREKFSNKLIPQFMDLILSVICGLHKSQVKRTYWLHSVSFINLDQEWGDIFYENLRSQR